MLINPYKKRLQTYPGTRIVSDRLGVIGASIEEPRYPGRVWTVSGLYAPTSKRALGGIRTKLEDQKGFVSFCNQRDFEVLLEVGKPGDRCLWAGQDYIEPDGNGWWGLCMDDNDLVDDLLDRELLLRSRFQDPILPSYLEISRRVHISAGIDAEELLLLLFDADRDTGMGPDPRLETIESRWSKVESERVEWKYLE